VPIVAGPPIAGDGALELSGRNLADARPRKSLRMEEHEVRSLVLLKIADGRLPRRTDKLWAGPGNGEVCDACERPIAPGQYLMEGVDGGRTLFRFHRECFAVWNAAR